MISHQSCKGFENKVLCDNPLLLKVVSKKATVMSVWLREPEMTRVWGGARGLGRRWSDGWRTTWSTRNAPAAGGHTLAAAATTVTHGYRALVQVAGAIESTPGIWQALGEQAWEKFEKEYT